MQLLTLMSAQLNFLFFFLLIFSNTQQKNKNKKTAHPGIAMCFILGVPTLLQYSEQINTARNT